MDSTLNEYVHEVRNLPHPQGGCVVIYEPVDNRRMLAVFGCVIMGRKSCCPFKGSHGIIDRIDGEDAVRWQRQAENGAEIEDGIFNSNTGIIYITWDKYPGEHALCVSYTFDTGPESEPVIKEPVNWIKEGF